MVPPATATVSGKDSLSSTESTFRQLDDVFLQTQTRIWLGEVLHTRFDEQLDIGDLLSDGELLCDVSKILWNMLLVKFMELRHVKTLTRIPTDSRKRSGRYMPYSNVDSFLKVCKVIGLDGIDLFSPSDVVEKRDTRKVCICIRSLSKKARSKQLNVPDFDIVTYTIAMPTDIVGCIRKSLELSRGRIMAPVHSSRKDEKTSLRQKSSVAACDQMNESCPEDSYDAKSSSTGLQSYVSYQDNCHVDPLELDLDDSTGGHSTVNNCKLSEKVDETEDFLFYSEHLPESLESICFRYFSKLNSMASHGYESQTMLCDKGPHLNGAGNGQESSVLDLIDVARGEGNDASSHISQQLALSDPTAFHTNHHVPLDEDYVSGSCMDSESYGSNSTPENSKFGGLSSYPDNIDDVEVSSKMSMNSLLSGRVLLFDFDAKHDKAKLFGTEFLCYEAERMENLIAEFREVQDIVKYERPLHSPSPYSEESHIEVELESSDLSVETPLSYSHEMSLYSSMCQDVELVDNRVGPNQSDSVETLCIKNTNLIVAVNDLEIVGEVRDDDKAVMHARLVDSDSDIKGIADIHFPVDCCNNVVDRTSIKLNGKEDGTHAQKTSILANECESSAQKRPCSIYEVLDDVDRACQQTSTADLLSSHGQHTNEDERKGSSIENLRAEKSEANNYKRGVEKQKKPILMMPLLKTVAKGTALIGVMFLLHLRIRNDREKKDEGGGEKPSRENNDKGCENSSKEEKDEGGGKPSKKETDEGGEQPIPVQKSNGIKLSSWKEKKGSSEVYPAEKLKLGD